MAAKPEWNERFVGIIIFFSVNTSGVGADSAQNVNGSSSLTPS